jgi:nucleoside-diphosphate-sugar epimerase
MSHTLVIGAHGQIGQHLCRLASEAGHPVRAMVRDLDQSSAFDGLEGVEVVHGDLEGDFQQALEGCDQVVFSAGSGASTGADKTLLIDLWGAVRVIDACAEKGVDQLVLVSSFHNEDPLAGPDEMAPYLAAKRTADLHLHHVGKAKGLTYTIVKPGQLTDDEGTARIRTTLEGDGTSIPRVDVARCLLAAVQNPDRPSSEKVLLSGDRPIAEVFAS